MMRGMGIFIGVAERVVHPVQDRVSTGAQVRGTLGKVSEQIEEAFPRLAHNEHFMSGIAMQKKGLTE